MKTEKQQVGARGENEACDYLSRQGLTVIERNWRHSHLELDIIALGKDGIHFVEVKSRTAPVMADPEVNVDRRKRKRIVSAALAFLRNAKSPALRDAEVFFDILTVVFHPDKVEIEYYPQAFLPTYV